MRSSIARACHSPRGIGAPCSSRVTCAPITSSTAAAFHDDVSQFIAAAVSKLAAEGKAAINRIVIDGRAIAAAITLRSGAAAWFWKIAYDENSRVMHRASC